MTWRSKKYLEGPRGAHRRAVFKSMGYTDEDLKRPLVGVANTWSELSPGHYHLRSVAEAVKAGIWQAGGTPLEFCQFSQCATITLGLPGVRYDTPTRDIIAASVEAAVELHLLDGVALISTCDKVVPGHLLAAARLNLPSIIVPGGPMQPGTYRDKVFMLPDLDEMVWGTYEVGKASEEEISDLEDLVCPGPGACAVMGTANTMQCLSEAVGMALPYAATAPAISGKRLRIAKESGRQVVELIRRGTNSSSIMTTRSLENMIRVYMALGGSTNAVIHILALVQELGIEDAIDLDTIERIGSETPVLVPVRPCGPYNVFDLDEAGGIPAVMKELMPLLHLDAVTVTGMTLKENLQVAQVRRREVIRTLAEPVSRQGGIVVLRGTLANSAIVRPLSIKREMWKHAGPARVFDSQDDALAAIWDKKIRPGDIVVVRYEGPRGGPGLTEIYPVIGALVGMGLGGAVAVVTDGKLSGFASGPCICQVSPEAFLGGPMAAVREGDLIEMDIARKRLDLSVPDHEIRERLAAWRQPEPRVKKGILAVYAQIAEPAEKGAGLRMRL